MDECPYCGSDNIEAIEQLDDELVLCECGDCGEEFEEGV
jgi:transcription elongation factor Elf1